MMFLDYSVEIPDQDKLPPILSEIMDELKQAQDTGDDITFMIKIDEFEIFLKQALAGKKITPHEFRQLCNYVGFMGV